MFVARRLDNSIYGCWTVRQFEGQEELPDDNPEVVAFKAVRPPTDLSNVDNIEKTIKALALVMRDYTNALLAGTYTQKTIALLKSDFAAKYNGLP